MRFALAIGQAVRFCHLNAHQIPPPRVNVSTAPPVCAYDRLVSHSEPKEGHGSHTAFGVLSAPHPPLGESEERMVSEEVRRRGIIVADGEYESYLERTAASGRM